MRADLGPLDVLTCGPAWGLDAAGRAADDLAIARLPAALVRAQDAGALTRNLLIPEDVELVARRRLHGQRGARALRQLPACDRRPRLVRRVQSTCVGSPMFALREHARDRAVAALVAELEEEPHLVSS